MEKVVTKKVRISRADAARLRRLARQNKTTESEIFREGLDLVERRNRRRRAIEALARMAENRAPPRVRIRFR